VTLRPVAGAAVVLLLSGSSATAHPDLRQGRIAGSLRVFPDDRQQHVFYYPPGELAIAIRPGGEPDLHLLHARYTGTAARGDRGAAMIRSIFTVRVVMSGPTPPELAEARTFLAATARRSIELRPLPIRRLESVLVYTPVVPQASPEPTTSPSDDGPTTLPAGHFEAAPSTFPPRNGYWTERTYTLGLGAADAQLLTAALERGGVALSIGYAFLADGIGPDQPLQELTGSATLIDALESLIKSRPVSSEADQAARPHIVRAGAVGVTADLTRWPGLVQKVDLNDSAPPGYAAIDIHCYDFSQGSPAALYEKQVEIEASGIGGQPVTVTIAFTRAHPDLYARSVRFPVAVRLDRPYRLRVHEVAQDGTSFTTAWREQPWNDLVDVTSQPDAPREDSPAPKPTRDVPRGDR